MFAARLQPTPEVHTQTVARIGHNRPVRQSFTAHLVQQLERNLAFGLRHLLRGWDVDRLHPLRLAGPRLRQEQAQRQRVVTAGRGVVQRQRDLAVVRLAQRAGVLPRNADGMATLLGKAGVVDDDHSAGIGKGLCQPPTIMLEHDLLIPRGLVDKSLQCLLGIPTPTRHGYPPRQRLDALALAVHEQTLEINRRPARAGDDAEVTGELGDVVLQPFDNLRIQLHHRRARHTTTLQLDRKAPVDRLASRSRHKYHTTTE